MTVVPDPFPDIQQERDAAVDAIVETIHPKKIVVAGAGAGKTTAFKKLLERLAPSAPERRLVMTFIGGLKRDLEKDLSDHARIHTFHGYCFALIKQNGDVRQATGLTSDVGYEPRLGRLIKHDWEILKGEPAPTFVPKFRNLTLGSETDFFLERGRYFDAVGYEDSIGHIHRAFATTPAIIPSYDVVIVDEFQDFNKAEVAVIEQLSSVSDVVIAGDDDQALYGKLRGASEAFIRALYARADYCPFNLPFCMRCPSAIVEATRDIIDAAHSRHLLGDRIEKRFEPYPPAKVEVDACCPSILVVCASAQTPKANYFGKYIFQQIGKLTSVEISESYQGGFPTVLVIGGKPYLDQVGAFLVESGIAVETKAEPPVSPEDPYTRDDGFAALRDRHDSNLGWRILLDVEKPDGYRDWIAASSTGAPLGALISPDYRATVLTELDSWEPTDEEEEESVPLLVDKPTIRLATFEGSKGMSAQHVFILGLQEGRLPYNVRKIKSIEVRRMIVALTRTRRQCYLLLPTSSFVKGKRRVTRPSVFVDWIRSSRKNTVVINAAYWKRQ